MKATSVIQLVFPLLLYGLGALIMAVALYPSLYLVWTCWQWGVGAQTSARLAAVALGLGGAFFLFPLCLIFVCAACHRLFQLDLRPGRYGFFSVTGLRWVAASSLYMLVKYTCADFLVCTPMFNWYFSRLGAQLGSGVMINSKFIHDHSLLEIGEGTIIGGDAVISCHAAEKGQLVLRQIRIGKRCLIGQKAILMPGVVIEDDAVIGAGAIVLKDQHVPAGATWVGVPAKPH